MKHDEPRGCLICGGPQNLHPVSTEGTFAYITVDCENCRTYAVSYYLWYRLMLAGWEGPLMVRIRDRIVRGASGLSDLGAPPWPMVVVRAESSELAKLEHPENWMLMVLE